MSKTEEDVERLSNEARQVWGNPLVQDFMSNYPMKIFIQWLDETDPVVREALWNEARGVTAFKRTFLTHLAGGSALKKKREGSIADGIGPIV